MGLTQTVKNSRLELCEVGVVLGIQARYLMLEAPTLVMFEIESLRWQQAEFNVQTFRRGLHQVAFLVAGIVQEERDRNVKL